MQDTPPPQGGSLFRPNRFCPPPTGHQPFCHRWAFLPFSPPAKAMATTFETLLQPPATKRILGPASSSEHIQDVRMTHGGQGMGRGLQGEMSLLFSGPVPPVCYLPHICRPFPFSVRR